MTPQDLLFIQAKVSNSFLRAFYPNDYRAMQRQTDKTSKAVNKEVVLVKRTEKLTSDVNDRLAKVLFMLEKEISSLIESVDGIKIQSAEPPMNVNIEMLGDAMDDAGGWMLGMMDMLRRIRQRARQREKDQKAKEEAEKKAQEEADKQAKEEASAKKAEEEKAKQQEEAKKNEAKEPAPEEAKPAESPTKTTEAKPGDVTVKPDAVPKQGGIWESVKGLGSSLAEGASAVGKGAYALGEGLVIKGTVVAMAAMAAYEFLTQLYALTQKANAGQLTSNEYRKEVTKMVVRLVDQIGLAYAGAIIGAFAGSEVPVLGNLVGFITGLLAGAAIQYAVGGTVEEMTNWIIDKLWPSDATVTPTEQAAPQSTPVASLSPISTAEAEPAPEGPPATAAQLAAAVSAPPPAQGPAKSVLPAASLDPTPPVQAPDLAPQTEETQAGATNAARNIQQRVETTPPPSDTTASFNTGSNQAGPARELPPPTGEVLSTAKQYLNMSEGKDRATLNAFIGKNFGSIDVATTPWCAAFTNSVLASNQLPGTGSAAALSFLEYGAPVWDRQNGGDISSVQPGDIAVFTRGVGHGHVAFVESFTGDSITVLGGNQGDSSGGGGAVTESSRSASSLLAIRRPAAALAEGGKVHPKKGGTLTLIAEAGEPEYVVPQSKVHKFAHEMLAARPGPKTKVKKHTHVMVVPIYT